MWFVMVVVLLLKYLSNLVVIAQFIAVIALMTKKGDMQKSFPLNIRGNHFELKMSIAKPPTSIKACRG